MVQLLSYLVVLKMFLFSSLKAEWWRWRGGWGIYFLSAGSLHFQVLTITKDVPWQCQKPETPSGSSTWVVKSPSTWTIPFCLPGYISKNLDQICTSGDLTCYTVMGAVVPRAGLTHPATTLAPDYNLKKIFLNHFTSREVNRRHKG